MAQNIHFCVHKIFLIVTVFDISHIDPIICSYSYSSYFLYLFQSLLSETLRKKPFLSVVSHNKNKSIKPQKMYIISFVIFIYLIISFICLLWLSEVGLKIKVKYFLVFIIVFNIPCLIFS